MEITRICVVALFATSLAGAGPLVPTAAAQEGAEGKLGKVLKIRTEGNAASARSQEKIDGLSEDIDQLVAEYRSTLQQIDALRVYNGQLEKLVVAQEEEATDLEAQIGNVALVGRQVTPLMLQMIQSLEKFVELDAPFLPKERRQRLEALREIMERADVSDAERYRRVLEAYQIENEYGRTIEAYQGTLEVEGESRTVDFLRVGRIAFVYQTLDGAATGVWDRQEEQWVPLSGDYRQPIRQGLRIARKQAAQNLIRLPVRAAEALQ